MTLPQPTNNQSPAGTTYPATLSALTQLAADVYHAHVTTEHAIPYRAGQFCFINVGPATRAYSMANLPGSPHLEFLINTTPGGPASHFFTSTTLPAQLSLNGPYGEFVIKQTPNPLLFIAGSSGLAPIWAQIQSITQTNPNQEITLIVGHTKKKNIFWHDLLTQASQTKNFTYVMTCQETDRQRPTDIIKKIKNIQQHTIYICGGTRFVTATADTIYRRAVPPDNVHYELFT